MSRRCYLFACCFALFLAAGCGPTKPKEASVKGQVKLDGKPMEEGEISFSLSGKAPKVFPVKNGAFTGQALEGKNRVEVRAYRPGAPMMGGDKVGESPKVNYLPAQYNDNTTFTADVTPSGTNEFSFEVTSQ